MAKIIITFNDGTDPYEYEVMDFIKAKKYAHLISTGKGCRKPMDDGKLQYFPVHRIKDVVVVPSEEDRAEARVIYERKRTERKAGEVA